MTSPLLQTEKGNISIYKSMCKVWQSAGKLCKNSFRDRYNLPCNQLLGDTESRGLVTGEALDYLQHTGWVLATQNLGQICENNTFQNLNAYPCD